MKEWLTRPTIDIMFAMSLGGVLGFTLWVPNPYGWGCVAFVGVLCALRVARATNGE